MHHTVTSYDLELTNLKNDIISMANLVKELLQVSLQSIHNFSPELQSYARKTDYKINCLDNLVETRATAILALRQPMAIDLRKCLAALRMAVILERMGDILKNITYRGQSLGKDLSKESQEMINNIYIINLEMLTNTIISYNNNDHELANLVFQQDKEIDKIYSDLVKNLKEHLRSNSSITESIVNTLFAAKNLERLGDYTKKLANLTNYIITGNKL